MKPVFKPEDRTYFVSDERLKAFQLLTPAQRLKWVEEIAMFLRLAKLNRKQQTTNNKQQTTNNKQ